MSKKNVYKVIAIIFTILTFVGALYVLANKGQVNAGYAIIPMLITLVFITLWHGRKGQSADSILTDEEKAEIQKQNDDFTTIDTMM